MTSILHCAQVAEELVVWEYEALLTEVASALKGENAVLAGS